MDDAVDPNLRDVQVEMRQHSGQRLTLGGRERLSELALDLEHVELVSRAGEQIRHRLVDAVEGATEG